jgi:beta-lactamase class A
MKPRFFLVFGLLIIISAALFYGLYIETSTYAAAHKSYQGLADRIQALAKDFPGEYSFIIKDTQKPFLEISRYENKMFPAASLIKVPLAAIAFKAAHEGRVSLSEIHD